MTVGKHGESRKIQLFQRQRAKRDSEYTRGKIREEILELDRKGIPLNARNIKDVNPRLYNASQNHFGSWKNAIESARFDYSKIRLRETWSREKVIKEIEGLRQKKVPPSSRYAQAECPRLYAAACRYFGGWGQAITAAGLDYDEITKIAEANRRSKSTKWSREVILMELEKLRKKNVRLLPNRVRKVDPGLYYAIHKRFGKWEDALATIGVDYDAIRTRHSWTRPRILSEIQQLSQNGEKLNTKSIQDGHPRLYCASLYYFKSWKNALEEAGICYDDVTLLTSWTKGKIIHSILSMKSKGEPLNDSFMNRNHTKLYSAALSRFGSWKKAIESAGISYDEVALVGRWDKEKIVERIQSLKRDGHALNARNVQQIGMGGMYNSAVRIFGSWGNAIEAAGFDLGKIQLRRNWNREDVLRTIGELYNSLGEFNDAYVKREAESLYNAAVFRFGSWGKAVEAAGLDYDSIRLLESWSKDKVLRRIEELNRAKKPLSAYSVKNLDSHLYCAGISRFGSWRNAIETAGFDYDEIRMRQTWSKEGVVESIQDLAQVGEDLSSHYMQENHKRLMNAAIKHWGNWKSAIEAAGLDYSEIRRTMQWSKKRVIQRILSLKANSESLAASYMQKHHLSLIAAGQRHFGTWKDAIEAAGLDYHTICLDSRKESQLGRIFESLLKRVFDIIGLRYHYQRRFRFSDEVCIPDFVIKDTGTWIDAKYRSWSGGIRDTIRKYSKHSPDIMIVYLVGKRPTWLDQEMIEFKSARDYYPRLRKAGREDIVMKLELLSRGIVSESQQLRFEDS